MSDGYPTQLGSYAAFGSRLVAITSVIETAMHDVHSVRGAERQAQKMIDVLGVETAREQAGKTRLRYAV